MSADRAPEPRTRILFDGTHGSATALPPPGAPPGFTPSSDLERVLVAAGYEVSRFTGAEITPADLEPHDVFVVAVATEPYSASEKQAMVDFVEAGGGLYVCHEHGNFPQSATREVLRMFGAHDEGTVVTDPRHSEPQSSDSWLVLEPGRNFRPHTILKGVRSARLSSATSLAGDAEWVTVIESDDDAMPPRRPLLMARAFGQGRVVAVGDWSFMAYNQLYELDNQRLATRCLEWLLFQI